jgi:hypothetical protein
MGIDNQGELAGLGAVRNQRERWYSGHKAAKTHEKRARRDGGAEGVRTPDLLNAIQALYQLSYDPIAERQKSKTCA